MLHKNKTKEGFFYFIVKCKIKKISSSFYIRTCHFVAKGKRKCDFCNLALQEASNMNTATGINKHLRCKKEHTDCALL